MKRWKLVPAAALFLAASYGMAQMTPGAPPPMGGQQPGMGQPGGMHLPGMGEPGMGGTTTTPGMDQTKVDDQTLDRQVHEELRTQSEMNHVQARVDNGVVYLEGSVPSKEDRRQAEKIVQAIPGVRGVKNKLKVEPTTSEVTGANREPSTVTGGTAGAVASGQSAEAGVNQGASNPAQSTVGSPGTPASSSTGVSNETGSYGSQTPSSQLQQMIDNAFRNEPTLVRDSLATQVTETSIELNGAVRSGKEKQTATRIARSYARNRKVIDHITVAGGTSGANSGNAGESGTEAAVSPGSNMGANGGMAGTVNETNTNTGAGASQPGMTMGTTIGTTSGTNTGNPTPRP